jgi:hypothetical protein
MKVKIKEQSVFAKMAAHKLKSKTVAIVLGHTIHLWNVNRKDFLKSTPWVVHEIAHVRQFERYGFLRFSVLYLIESIRNGYYNNRYEKEARNAEAGALDMKGIEFV